MRRRGAIASPVRARFTRSRQMARSGDAPASPCGCTRPGRAGSPFRSRCHGGSWRGRCSLEQHHDAGGRVIGHRRTRPGGLVAGVLGPVQRLRRSGRGARAVVSVLSANRTVSGRSQFWSRLCAYTRVDCRLQRAGEQRKQTSLHPGRRSSLSLNSERSAVRPAPDHPLTCYGVC